MTSNTHEKVDVVHDKVVVLISKAFEEVNPVHGDWGIRNWMIGNPEWHELCELLNIEES